MSPGLFDGRAQRAIRIRGTPAKSPMFFRDLHMMGAVFLADFARVRAALPRECRPLRLPLGRALVAVHCMEYKDTDIGPYNEVALSVALRAGWLPLPSLARAALDLRSRTMHAHIHALPVTTELALHGGVDFFNYPKYLADIRFRETAGHRVCTLRDPETLDLICEFEGRRIGEGNRAGGDGKGLTLLSYPWIGGRAHRARLELRQLEGGERRLRPCANLRLGPHPRAEAFRELGLGAQVHYLFAPRCQAVLFEPEPL
ncbi:MAG: acetoacetate decarboxylase family protein [Elusimicrobia bacterium]|nr:acetoacetate decarboxylase family protein [Elusimicrobiota bacterium]